MAGLYHINKVFFNNPLRFDFIKIFQIGRLYCKSDTVVPTHLHTNLYELTVVTDGSGIIYTNNIPTPVKQGDIYFSHPFDSHSIESDPEQPLKFDFIAFFCDKDPFKNEIELMAQEYHAPQDRVFKDENIAFVVGNAIAEVCNNNIYSNELLETFLKQILIFLIRSLKKQNLPNRSTVTETEILCYRLMNYIDTHIYSLKNLDELADIFDYSYSYLSSVFKKTTSNTLLNYYNKKKMDVAKLLILKNKIKITEIAEKLNYSSVYSFSKAFAKYYGTSPRNYFKCNKPQIQDNEIIIY